MQYISSTEFKQLARKGRPKGVGLRKAFNTTTETMPDRCVKFIISTDAVDRQMDRVMQDGWILDNYLRNPVVLFGHDDSEPPVGKCISIGLEDGQLKAVVQFMPGDYPVYGAKAEAIYRMCCEGFLNATSVGFRPVEFQMTTDPARGAHDFDGGGCDFITAELVEFSIVSVPCNPEALIEATPLPPALELAAEPAESKAHPALNTARARMKMQMEFLRF